MKEPQLDKEVILRRLFDALATYMSEGTTFNEIARLFFIHGFILRPEKPFGVYEGSKKDYVLEKLIAAQNVGDFSQKLADLIWEITMPVSWGETQQIDLALDVLGFQIINEAFERKAPKKLPKINQGLEKIGKKDTIEDGGLNWVYYTNIFWLMKKTLVFLRNFIRLHKLSSIISFFIIIFGLLAIDYAMAWKNIKAVYNFIKSLF